MAKAEVRLPCDLRSCGDFRMSRLSGRTGSALVAIVTIVDEEFDAVRATGGFKDFVGNSSYLYRTSPAADCYDAILAKSSDRSNTPCSELVADLSERFRPEFIVLSGIAGGVSNRDGVSLGDVVIADHVEGYEMRKLSNGHDLTRRIAIDHPSIFLRETIVHRVKFKQKWINKIIANRPIGGEPKIIIGNIIAGEKILGDGENAYQLKILSEFDKALAVDMESYGLARGVYTARGTRHYNLNYLVVRGISDMADDKANDQTRKQWRDYAAATAAAFSMSVVDEIVAACPWKQV